MKLWHGAVIAVGALALLGGGVGSTVSHVAQGVDNVTSAAGGGDSSSIIPPDVRLTAEAAGGYALAKGGAARLSQPKTQSQAAPAPAPTTSTTIPPPGPLLHPWAATPTTVAPAPAAPLGDTSKGGWHFGVPSLGNLGNNLEGIGRAVIPGASGGTSPAVPMPAPAPPVPIVVVP